MPSLRERLHLLERAGVRQANLPRLFVRCLDEEPAGFRGGVTEVRRRPGETLAELQARCEAMAPGVTVWQALRPDG